MCTARSGTSRTRSHVVRQQGPEKEKGSQSPTKTLRVSASPFPTAPYDGDAGTRREKLDYGAKPGESNSGDGADTGVHVMRKMKSQ